MSFFNDSIVFLYASTSLASSSTVTDGSKTDALWRAFRASDLDSNMLDLLPSVNGEYSGRFGSLSSGSIAKEEKGVCSV